MATLEPLDGAGLDPYAGMLAETLREWSREKKLALSLTAGVNEEIGLAVLKVEQTKDRRRFPHGAVVQRTRGSREAHRGRRHDLERLPRLSPR